MREYNQKKGITKSDLDKIVEFVFKEEASPRFKKFRMTRSCLTYGYIVSTSNDMHLKYCDNPECGGCVMMREVINDELKKMTNELKKESLQELRRREISILERKVSEVCDTGRPQTPTESSNTEEGLQDTKTDSEKQGEEERE